MQDNKEIRAGNACARLVFRELRYGGAGYLRLWGVQNNSERDALLHMGASELLAAGAKRVFCGFLNDGTTKVPKTCGFLSGESFFSFAYDVDWLETPLSPQFAEQSTQFVFVPLDRVNAQVYQRVYNEAFSDVPGFSVFDEDSVETLLDLDATSAELVVLCGEPAGILELSRSDGVGCIDGIALLPCFRRKGLGRALLRSALFRLKQEGMKKAALTVSSVNTAAYSLYRAEGFQKTSLQCRWFRLEMDEDEGEQHEG